MGEDFAGGVGKKMNFQEDERNGNSSSDSGLKIVGSEDHPLRYRYFLGFEWTPRGTIKMVLKKLKLF